MGSVLLNTTSSSPSLSSSSLSSSSSYSSSTLQPTMFSSSGIPSHVQDLKLKKLFDLKNTKRSWLPPVSLDTISTAEKRTLDQSKKPPQNKQNQISDKKK